MDSPRSNGSISGTTAWKTENANKVLRIRQESVKEDRQQVPSRVGPSRTRTLMCGVIVVCAPTTHSRTVHRAWAVEYGKCEPYNVSVMRGKFSSKENSRVKMRTKNTTHFTCSSRGFRR